MFRRYLCDSIYFSYRNKLLDARFDELIRPVEVKEEQSAEDIVNRITHGIELRKEVGA